MNQNQSTNPYERDPELTGAQKRLLFYLSRGSYVAKRRGKVSTIDAFAVFNSAGTLDYVTSTATLRVLTTKGYIRFNEETKRYELAPQAAQETQQEPETPEAV